MATRFEDRNSLRCCCCVIENESCDMLAGLRTCLGEDDTNDGPCQGKCCTGLRVLVLPVLATLAGLLLQATDCDVGITRFVAGSGLLLVFVLEAISSCRQCANSYERTCFISVLQTLTTILEVAVLILLMIVSVNAVTWLPSDCNNHRVQSLEVVAGTSIAAMLVVQFYLAVNCRTNTTCHSCSIVVISPGGPSLNDDLPDTEERRFLCLVCDVPQGGRILARQAGLTQSLSCLQVLLSLLGWALLLAGCLLLNSNYPSPPPLLTAAGALTVTVGGVAIIGGWIGFLGETAIFVDESALGMARLDRAVLVLSSMLLILGAAAIGLLVAVAVETRADAHLTTKPPGVNPEILSSEWTTAASSTSLSDYAVHEVRITVYVALAFLLLLLLLAVRNNAVLCRCQNCRCNEACFIVLTDPERAPLIDEYTRRHRYEEEAASEEDDPINAESSSTSSVMGSTSVPTRSSSQCRMCLARKITHAFQPCGHLCSCSDCACQVGDRCPVCRTPIEDAIRIYV